MFRLLSHITIYKPWTYGGYLKKEYTHIYMNIYTYICAHIYVYVYTYMYRGEKVDRVA